MDGLTLARYEAQGNDFLIALLTESQLGDFDRSLGTRGLTRRDVALAACDRYIGVGSRPGYVHLRGADGFILGVHNALEDRHADWVRMHLLNADGSFAEVSGNGLASLAYAAFDAGVVAAGLVPFETDSGTCRIRSDGITARDRPGVEALFVEVTMGSVVQGKPSMPTGLQDRIRADFGSALDHFDTGHVGNPHLVIALRGPIDANRTAELGAAYEMHFPDGINVEFIWLQRNEHGDGDLAMGVWERGVGLTHSCGSGSVVAATLARRWEIAPDKSIVKMITVPKGWEVGANDGNGRYFSYRVHTDPPPRLRVMAEKIETGLTLRLDDIPALLDDLAAMTESKR